MGDIVMTLPAIEWLRTRFQNCYICYFTDRAFAKIPELSGLTHRVETFDRRGFLSYQRVLSATMGTIFTLLRLRRMQFDIVFDLQGFGETSMFACLTGAPVRVGRIKGSPLRKRLYTVPIQTDWEHEHRANYFLRAIKEAFGIHNTEMARRPQLPNLQKHSDPSPRRIGLNLGASTASRRWSEHHFLKLADKLSHKGLIPRFFLGPQEAFLVSTVKKACQQKEWEFFALDNLTDLMKALSECHLLVSNDTGPNHLATALNLPVITLFSTGSPENVRPLTTRAKWFRNETDINQITVVDVEKACLELLGLR